MRDRLGEHVDGDSIQHSFRWGGQQRLRLGDGCRWRARIHGGEGPACQNDAVRGVLSALVRIENRESNREVVNDGPG